MTFQHIAHRFEIWIEFLGPVWAKLRKNAFYAAVGWRLSTELAGGANYAVVLESMGKIATSPCSPYGLRIVD